MLKGAIQTILADLRYPFSPPPPPSPSPPPPPSPSPPPPFVPAGLGVNPIPPPVFSQGFVPVGAAPLMQHQTQMTVAPPTVNYGPTGAVFSCTLRQVLIAGTGKPAAKYRLA